MFGTNKKRLIRAACAVISAFILVLLVFDLFLFPLPVEMLDRPSSTFVYSRDGQLLRCFLSPDGFWRKPVHLSEISPLLKQSVIEREDRWFYYHPGFNPASMIAAVIDNARAGKIVRGGSTITMQIARMMEPKNRTVKSKIIELFRAIQLEIHYTKDELLEIYFNIAPYGGNIEGIGAAAYFYLGKKTSELTASQAALLTSMPNHPGLFRSETAMDIILAKRNAVLKTMLERSVIELDDYRDALDENIEYTKNSSPFLVPHHAGKLAREFPGRSEIYSTIDLQIQNICEAAVSNVKSDLKERGINNAAVAVIDNSNSELLALIGSSDFFNSEREGQVNGALAPRSPGSALKPFAYALGIDAGILTPASIMSDLPVQFAGYSPENYDKEYRGVVKARDALKMSLNVPAVNLCHEVGLREFYGVLKKGGVTTLDREYYNYGLPLILGSCEVNLLELTSLYASLARMGLYLPVKQIMDEPDIEAVRLFSSGASFIISDILAELKRPDFPSSWEFSPSIPKVAWKTGTSYGRKDAWSVGYNPRFTIGVWVGNFNGDPSPYIVGAEAAAPVLFDIFESISSREEGGWFIPPEEVSERPVCEISGMKPGRYCGVTINELYIPGISPELPCNIHREIIVDKSTGFKLCRFCAPGKQSYTKIAEDWDPKTATWLYSTGRLAFQMPEHNPGCTGATGGDLPVIVSPDQDMTYIIRDHIASKQQGILLDATAAAGTRNIYWFVDGELYDKTAPGNPVFFIPRCGIHEITCLDDRGRSSSIKISVM